MKGSVPKKTRGKKLSIKQEAVIADVIRSVNGGGGFSVAGSVEKIYNATKESASTLASRYLRDDDFRGTLLSALESRKIIGANSKVERRLVEGLDAETVNGADYHSRLEYIKEINKIVGVYAPEKRETKSLSLNLNMTKEELDEKVRSLQEELDS